MSISFFLSFVVVVVVVVVARAQSDQILKYKVAQKFPKVAQKVNTAKWMLSKQPKMSTYILATFVRKSVSKNQCDLGNT